jgi:SpoVK/Ycf46/Vps4 family AAA+-type ATPase
MSLDYIIHDREKVNLSDVLLEPESQQAIEQLIKEFEYVSELSKFNLPVNNKILLQGSSGCGKTTTAKAIATALKKQLYILSLGNFISPRIGETAQNLKSVFEKTGKDDAVLFLDEFDQIGKARNVDEKDVGEMRRIVNTLIQLIDYLPNTAVLIAATNHPGIIDTALSRRFQLILNYELPDKKMLDTYYEKLLSPFPEHLQNIERKYNLSFAEAKDYAYSLLKSLLIKEMENQKK